MNLDDIQGATNDDVYQALRTCIYDLRSLYMKYDDNEDFIVRELLKSIYLELSNTIIKEMGWEGDYDDLCD